MEKPASAGILPPAQRILPGIPEFAGKAECRMKNEERKDKATQSHLQATCKPPASHLQARGLRHTLVFCSYFARVLLVFSSCLSLFFPVLRERPCGTRRALAPRLCRLLTGLREPRFKLIRRLRRCLRYTPGQLLWFTYPGRRSEVGFRERGVGMRLPCSQPAPLPSSETRPGCGVLDGASWTG